MKTSSLLGKITLLTLALGTAGVATTFAADSTTSTPPPAAAPDKPKHGGFGAGVLTPDEQAQLQKAHDAALAADPALQAESDKLKTEDRKTARDDFKAFGDKLRAAELKIDPTLAPLFAKIDAARAAKKASQGGGSAPAPSGA